MKKAKNKLTFQLNQISRDETNPLLLNANFSILDLEVSGNGHRLEKETVDNVLPLIKDMPVTAKYYPVSEAGAEDDNFGTHEQMIDTDRDGEEFVTTGTIPIGHFVSEGRYETVEGIENVVVADAVLYGDKYPNQIDLLIELYNQGIKINTSCEYYYNKNNVTTDVSGVEVIGGTILFGAHTILGSNPNGVGGVIDGAYEVSKVLSLNNNAQSQWNASLNSLLTEIRKDEASLNNSGKEVNTKEKGSNGMFEKVIKLADNDIRVQLYNALEQHMSEEEFGTVYIAVENVKDNSFVYQVNEGESVRWYEVESYENKSFVNVEGELKLEYATKTEVTTEYYDVYNQLAEAKNELSTKTDDLEKANNELVLANHNKVQVENQLKEATDSVITLNEKIKGLESELEGFEDIKNQLETERKEKALNELTEDYSAKFEKVGAKETFESEEVQNMLTECIEDESKADSIKASLNSKIIDIVMNSVNEQEQEEQDQEEMEQSLNSKVKGENDVVNLNNKEVNNLLDNKEVVTINKYIED